jgi:hypothetical protein
LRETFSRTVSVFGASDGKIMGVTD